MWNRREGTVLGAQGRAKQAVPSTLGLHKSIPLPGAPSVRWRASNRLKAAFKGRTYYKVSPSVSQAGKLLQVFDLYPSLATEKLVLTLCCLPQMYSLQGVLWGWPENCLLSYQVLNWQC